MISQSAVVYEPANQHMEPAYINTRESKIDEFSFLKSSNQVCFDEWNKLESVFLYKLSIEFVSILILLIINGGTCEKMISLILFLE